MGQAVFLFGVVIGLVLIICLFLYGSILAILGGAKKEGYGLLTGNILIAIGFYLFFNGMRMVYNDKMQQVTNSDIQHFLGFLFISLGLLTFSSSFVLYVKKHNKNKQNGAS